MVGGRRTRIGARATSASPAVDASLFLVSAAAGVGLCRLTTAAGSWHTLAPVLLAVAGGHAVVAAVSRRRPRIAALGTGVLAVALVCIWWFEPGTTLWGLPTARTARALSHLLSTAGHSITSAPTPVRAGAGVVLCVAAGAGLAAVLARWLSTRRPGPVSVAGGLVAPTGLFLYTALLSSDVGRVWGAASFLAAVGLFVAAADRARRLHAVPGHPVPGEAVPGEAVPGDAELDEAGRDGSVRGADMRSRRAPVVRTALVLFAALAVPLAASPALAGMRLDALPFGRHGASGTPGAAAGEAGARAAGAGIVANGGGDGGGAAWPDAAPGAVDANVPSLSTLALVDDLGAVLSDHRADVLFTAVTPVPTYWQMATLTSFDGRVWSADPVTRSDAAHGGWRALGGPPVLPEPARPGLFSASMSMVGLRTGLLPVPPGTMGVSGAAPVRLLPGIGAGSIITSFPGLSYVAVAPVPGRSSPSPPPAAGGATGAPVGAAQLAPYLALPHMAPEVVALAHSIVRGASGARAEAMALAGWFRSGRFVYSLHPPAAGSDPLGTFLFHTRTGFCQQFAAAFAVLARIDGVPTRLAIGFTAGRRSSDGETVVTGADAHVWPEVYLGPQAGWVSAEPTPAAGDGVPVLGMLSGPPVAKGSAPGTLGEIRKAGLGAGTPSVTTPSSVRTSAPGAARGGGGRARPGAGVAVRWLLVALAGAAVVLGAVTTRRRWTGAMSELGGRLRTPSSAVLGSWRRAARELDHRHLGRAPQETMGEHARRLSSGRPALARPYGELVTLATRACYGADALSHADAARARRLRADVCAAAGRGGHRARGRRQPSATTSRRPASSSSRSRSAP